MTRQRLLEALNRLNVWKSGGTRAPPEPLLLLFGPPHKAVHPVYPFWHLTRRPEGSGNSLATTPCP